MELTELEAAGLNASLYGPPADRVWLYVHGRGGCKEEAADFAALACPQGWQVLAADLPEHGARRGDRVPLDPWHAAPELRALLGYAKGRWQHTALRCHQSGGLVLPCWPSPGGSVWSRRFRLPGGGHGGAHPRHDGVVGVSEAQLEERPASWTLPSGETLSWPLPPVCPRPSGVPLAHSPPPCCTPPGTPCSAGRR